jgi:hypothetical protein
MKKFLSIAAVYLLFSGVASAKFTVHFNNDHPDGIKKLISDTLLKTAEPDYKIYAAGAEELSNLYRGVAPISYRFIYNGTCYAYKEDFEIGNLFYNGKVYRDVLLNLNAHTGELVVKVEKTGFLVRLNRDFVSSFTIGNHRFVNVKDFEDTLLSPGYYEVIFDGHMKLLKKIKKNYAERINQSANASSNIQIDRSFNPAITYYLITGNSKVGLNKPEGSILKVIKRKAGIISSLKEHKKEVRQFIRKNHITTLEKDAQYAAILNFAESLNPIQNK